MHGAASPVARRTAARLGVRVAALAGSGPRGRVLKADVIAAAAGPAPVAPAAPARATGPELTLAVDVDMGAAGDLCARLAPLAEPAPSVFDLVVKASAIALRELRGAGIHVAVDGARVIRDADRRSFGAIAADTRAEPRPVDVALTVSQLGVDRFAVAAGPLHLCAGAVRDAPAAVDGAVVVRPLMTLTLTCGDGTMSGPDGAALLTELRRRLEAPLSLAL